MEKGCTFAAVFDRKTEQFETNEKIEIACVNLHIKICRGHEDESKGKKNNSYNEEFDPGSG